MTKTYRLSYIYGVVVIDCGQIIFFMTKFKNMFHVHLLNKLLCRIQNTCQDSLFFNRYLILLTENS